MDYSALDKPEYKGIETVRIKDNNNDLPFFIAKRKDLNTTIHRHEFVQIIYVARGSSGHVINDNSFTVYKGDIFIMPPYVPHYFIPGGDAEIFEYEFIPEFINEKFSSDYKDNSFMDFAYLEPFLVAGNMIKPRLNLSGNIQREVEGIFNRILVEYEQRDKDFELVIKALTLQLLIMVSRQYSKNEDDSENNTVFIKHRDSLQKTIEYIEGNYNECITLDDAVRVSLLSKSYFGYLFKHMTHKTFTEYLNGVRVSKAIELLKTRHDLKVIDICFLTGYNNVNHFNRIFRAETGCTPMQIRKNKI
ncbi:MAG: helix-turn-helix domain-containing protein [Clostridia bacterium]|nr:helix-turn-helix domain-containing protein [Clostridia bacterium]